MPSAQSPKGKYLLPRRDVTQGLRRPLTAPEQPKSTAERSRPVGSAGQDHQRLGGRQGALRVASSLVSLPASEAWSQPEESDGDYVRRIYLHFDRIGIQNDGLDEGQEWTRNRQAGVAPWTHRLDANGLARRRSHESDIRARTQSTPAGPSGVARPKKSRSSRVLHNAAREAGGAHRLQRKSGGGLEEDAALPKDSVPDFDPSSARAENVALHRDSTQLPAAPAPPRKPTSEGRDVRGQATDDEADVVVDEDATSQMSTPSSAPVSAIDGLLTPSSAAPTLDLSRIGNKPLQKQRRFDVSAAGDSVRQDDGSQLDRYGFFDSPNSASSSTNGRIVLLPAACFDILPLPGSSRPSKGKARAASRAALAAIERVQGQRGQRSPRAPQSGLILDPTRPDGHSSGPRSPADPAQAHARQCEAKARQADVIHRFRKSAIVSSRAKEETRINKWLTMLGPTGRVGANASSYEVLRRYRHTVKLESRVFKGIPDRWRAAAWWALLESNCWRQRGQKQSAVEPTDRMAQASAATAPPHLTASTAPETAYDNGEPALSCFGDDDTRRRDESATETQAQFQTLLQTSSPHDVQIDLDVPRTINNHIVFYTRYGLGQRSLFKVLHAFSLHCTECGYCQGMGGVAVTLLCYFEEQGCWEMMRRLHDAKREFDLHQTFAPGFPGLLEIFYVQGRLLKLLCPQLAELMEREGVTASAYATRWYITLFYSVVPFETQLRLWDVIMLVGSRDILPLFGLAILHAVNMTVFFPHTAGERGEGMPTTTQQLEPASLSSGPHDFESILSTLSSSNLFVPESDDAMMRWVRALLRDKTVRTTMREARREWAAIVAKGEEAHWM
ncbi:unnamed protein product [Parajaminaea phylloscopi]